MSQPPDVIGFFANMLPIRTTIKDDMSFPEYLVTFRCGSVADPANDDVTYEDISPNQVLVSTSITYLRPVVFDRFRTSPLFPNGEEK